VGDVSIRDMCCQGRSTPPPLSPWQDKMQMKPECCTKPSCMCLSFGHKVLTAQITCFALDQQTTRVVLGEGASAVLLVTNLPSLLVLAQLTLCSPRLWLWRLRDISNECSAAAVAYTMLCCA
jgi:hypothetical protein